MEWERVDPSRGKGACAVVAVALALGLSYQEAESALTLCDVGDPELASPAMRSPRDGTALFTLKKFLAERGWRWTPTMRPGTGCRVHLRAGELPSGTLIVRLSRHVCMVRDGAVYDTHDPRRSGSRCVYGYWAQE